MSIQRFAACAFLAGYIALLPGAAQSTAAPAPKTAPLVAPELRLPEPPQFPTIADGTRYLNRPELLAFCTQQLAGLNGRDADIVFIGDSIVSNWTSPARGLPVWNKYFAGRALNFGVSGDLTQHVLWRMQQYPIARLHPRVAVVMIGSNNTHNTPQEVAGGVQAVVERTRALWPDAKIILMSITPFRHLNQLAIDTNAIIRNYADNKTIFWVDLFSLMTPEGDNWKGIGPDHTHPNTEGYQMWADAILPLLDRLAPARAATHP